MTKIYIYIFSLCIEYFTDLLICILIIFAYGHWPQRLLLISCRIVARLWSKFPQQIGALDNDLIVSSSKSLLFFSFFFSNNENHEPHLHNLRDFSQSSLKSQPLYWKKKKYIYIYILIHSIQNINKDFYGRNWLC